MILINQNNLLESKQIGFRRSRSCVRSLNVFTEFMKETNEKGKYGSAGFIDLQKAFDTVNDEVLVK